MRRALLFVGLLLTSLVVGMSPAFAYSMVPVRPVEEQLADEAAGLTGFYEVKVIAGTPSLLYRDVRTVSVVTRSWGDPPEELGRQRHGLNRWWYSDSCGGGRTGWLGEFHQGGRSEWPVTSRGLPRTWGTEEGGQLSAEQEQLLEERFGPPVVYPISTATVYRAWMSLWLAPGLIVLGVVTFCLGIRSLRRRRSKWSNARSKLLKAQPALDKR